MKPCLAIIFENLSDKELKTAVTLADEKRDRIIATVSHELRTPINGILGLLKMSLERSGHD
jgi:signal transduction histidine kinase